MFELQLEFATKVIMPFAHVLHIPLISLINNNKQENLEIQNLLICESTEDIENMEKEYGKGNIVKF